MSHILTPTQEQVIDIIKGIPFIVKGFYFTGGTALSEYYLQHRYSDDLDFFSFLKFDGEALMAAVQTVIDKTGGTYTSFNVESTYVYNLHFPNGEKLKMDFSYYPYKPIELLTVDGGLSISSEADIAINKIVVVSQRNDVKDFVDLYFLLNKYPVLDLLDLSSRKFRRDYDAMLLASDFTKVNSFSFMPRMIKQVGLEDLKSYFLNLSESLGIRATSN